MSVPNFLRCLYEIMQEDSSIIGWTHSGNAFQVLDVSRLQHMILPKYFKHNKLSSFQRQLNYFGFRKWTKTQTDVCTFSHPYFLKGKKENLTMITKKNSIPNAENMENRAQLQVSGKRSRCETTNVKSPSTKCLKKTVSCIGFTTPSDAWAVPFENPIDITYDDLVAIFMDETDLLDTADFFRLDFEF